MIQSVIKKNRARVKGTIWFVGQDFAVFDLSNPVVLDKFGNTFSYGYGEKKGEFHADTRSEMKLGIEDFYKKQRAEKW